MLTGGISGDTALAGVIGWPVSHSRSPAIHNAAYAASGLDMVYVAFAVAPGSAPAAVSAMRTLGIAGLSVTMPHKQAVIEALDEVTARAATLGAVNCITNDGTGRLVGDNTDGAGFLAGFEHDTGRPVKGLDVIVLGAGGAARAIIEATAGAGASSIGVLNRDQDRARFAAAFAGPLGYLASVADLPSADLIVNATSVGMAGTDGAGRTPIDVGTIGAAATVVDIVYDPTETPLLAAARRRGLEAHGGISMLAGQARVQIERWTGEQVSMPLLVEAARSS